jgi:hypothetical protein
LDSPTAGRQFSRGFRTQDWATAEEDLMSAYGSVDGAPTTPTLKRDWRFYVGLTAFVLAWLMPLSAALVPALGLPLGQPAILAGVLVAGGPEVLCVLAVVLLGKDTVRYFGHTIKRVLLRVLGDKPVSKGRYYIGLTVLLVSMLPAYVFAYFPELMPPGNGSTYVLVTMDLAFVASVCAMGPEFWEKMRRVFVYDGHIPS